MNIELWWPKLRPSTREWLIENNGDVVPAAIVAEITAAGGSIDPNKWWVGRISPSGFFVSDEAADWIEEIANGEDPEPPNSST